MPEIELRMREKIYKSLDFYIILLYNIIKSRAMGDEMPRQGELKREFTKAGCYKVREDTNHERWYSPITNQEFHMGRHDNQEIKPKTEATMRKQAGVPKKR